MTALGSAILQRAEHWADLSCKETVKNGGNCIDTLQIAFSGKLIREAYCAKFAWVVVSEACKQIGVANKLPKTAGAKDMLVRAKSAGLLVDTNPAPGCVGYRFSTAAGATGHIFVVKNVTSSRLYTIEGNGSRNDIGLYDYPLSKVNSGNGYQFIHTELMAGGSNSEAGFGLFGWLLLGGAAWYTIKSMK